MTITNLNDLAFWISPLTKELYVGRNRKHKTNVNLASSKRQITGLMMNGIAEVLLTQDLPFVHLEIKGKKYRMELVEITEAANAAVTQEDYDKVKV